MKIQLSFETENEKISQNYRFALLSFLKNVFRKVIPKTMKNFTARKTP